jgi:hypothetical protein
MSTVENQRPVRPNFRQRLRTIGMALLGPADSGPYGPPKPPPVPRPRDHRGRQIKQPKQNRLSYLRH